MGQRADRIFGAKPCMLSFLKLSFSNGLKNDSSFSDNTGVEDPGIQ
jgi:hypothetical protein